jgi:MFS family permease
MTMTSTETAPAPVAARPRIAWRWVHVGVAALAMVATLPGRTHGLGLFTEPILRSFQINRESYGFANLVATLLGGLFCLPCGWLLDRLGTRAVLVSVTAALGATVLAMTQIADAGPMMLTLFAALLLTRGFGQSALSVASLSLIGRSTGKRIGLAMGVYACLTTLGFIAAFSVLREVIRRAPDEWRGPWAGIGVAVLVAAVLMMLLVRDSAIDRVDQGGSNTDGSLTLWQALASPQGPRI